MTAKGEVGELPRALPKICLTLSYVAKYIDVPIVSRTRLASVSLLAVRSHVRTEVQPIAAVESAEATIVIELLRGLVRSRLHIGCRLVRGCLFSCNLASQLTVEFGQLEWT